MGQTVKVKDFPLVGVVASVLTGLAGTSVIAWLLIVGTIGDGTTDVLLRIWLCISAFLGGVLSVKNAKVPVYTPIVTAGTYFAILLICGLLFFDGDTHHVLLAGVLVVAGGAIACVIRRKSRGKTKRRKS